MKRTFNLGKIDFDNKGHAINAVTVEMEYTDKGDGKKTLSICGDIWNGNHSDIVCGGQCLDTIAEYIHTPLFKTLYRLWNLYHLNDMHPECEHQATLGWREKARESVTLYTFAKTSDAIREKNALEKQVLKAAMAGEPVTLDPIERERLALPYSFTSHVEALPENLAGIYKLDKKETKTLGWLYEKDHPEGLLCKPCPVCGYKYGSAWKYFPIPEEDEKTILDLLKG